jgi:hypothetical protein
MPHAMSQQVKKSFPEFLTVCPECGGRMGGRTKESKCQGECLRDWRDVWERRLAKPGKNTNWPQALGKRYKDYATTEAARVVVHKSAKQIFVWPAELPESLRDSIPSGMVMAARRTALGDGLTADCQCVLPSDPKSTPEVKCTR